MSIVLEDFDKCCRWCLTKAAKLQPIFNTSLDYMFLMVMNLKMERNDAYPQQVCRMCITKLSTAFNFHKTALKSHNTLTGILENQQSVQATLENQRTTEQTLIHRQIKDPPLSTSTDVDGTALIFCNTSESFQQTDTLPCADKDSETKHNLDVDDIKQEIYTFDETLDDNKLSLQAHDHDYVMQSKSQNLSIVKKNNSESDCTSDGEAVSIGVTHEIKCKICQCEFVDSKGLKKHLLSHKVQCDVCYRLVYNHNLEQHLEIHREDLPKPFECDICKHKFSTELRFETHVKKVHRKKNRAFLCSYCGSSFKTYSSHSRHMNRHTGRNLRICDVCDKKFFTRHSLVEHLKSHESAKPYPCESCNSGFTQMSSLRKHRRLQHAADGQYKCIVCEMILPSREALRKHKRSTHGRYRCSRCKISFEDASSLEVHNAEKHPNARKPSTNSAQTRPRRKRLNASTIVAKALAAEYYCCGCGQGLPALIDLQEHSTECISAALQCKMCPTVFADSQTLLNHYSKTHGALSLIDGMGGQRNVVLFKDNTST